MTTYRRKLADVDDGIIVGTIEAKGAPCHNCNVVTRVIHIDALALPKEFYYNGKGLENKLVSRLIFCEDNGDAISRIGIGCGCYAKGHRQIAHIKDRLSK